MKVLVIGGSGHFGGRICRRLALKPDLQLVAPGRDQLDVRSADLAAQLRDLNVDVVIHTAGPFQDQNYHVAEACIDAACHYVDLADGRDFVCEFTSLDERAKSAGVTLVCGASTLPGISSTVFEAMRARFAEIESIESSIAPAHQTPRGVGTVAAVLSYCGKPFTILRNGTWTRVHGWQDLRRQRYPGLGSRWSGACDVPDLELFPARDDTLRTVSFHAALEAWWEQLSLWLMAGVARAGFVRDWSRFSRTFAAASKRFMRFGSDRGGMRMRFDGTALNGEKMRVDWYLLANNNHGPEIPCTPSIVVALKLLNGEIRKRGAMACWNLFTMDEFMRELDGYDIWIEEEVGS